VISAEGVIDNIAGWLDGKEKLDVFALYDVLALRYGAASPTDYAARLLFDVYCAERDAEAAADG
jgi:hypothetical protein